MNKDDHEGLELIKEFLSKNGFKGTLECLEKEENYKNVVGLKINLTTSFPATLPSASICS